MNVIINGFHVPEQNEVLDKIIELCKPKKCCIILDTKTYSVKSDNIELLYARDIIYGNYSYKHGGIPVGFIEYINQNMVTLLDMCSRLEVGLEKDLRYEERKNIVYKHFAFWYHTILEKNYDSFIGSNIPHDIYDYILYLTMVFLKRKKIMYFCQSNFIDIIVPMEDYRKQTERINAVYQKYLLSGKRELSQLALTEWNSQKNLTVPFYMEKQKRRYIDRIWRNIVNGRLFELGVLWANFTNFLNNRAIEHEYCSLSVVPDLSKKYVYLPLHYQPELTTNPLGGIFSRQIFILDILLESIPDDVFVYVKEHPKQKYVCRYKGFYSDLARLSGKVRLIDKNVPSKVLIKESLCIATITGTAGWEALFMQKPVLLFGQIFYACAPYVYNITDPVSCNNALKEIYDTSFYFDEDKFKIFLNAVADSCIHGFIDPLYRVNSNFTFKQSNENIIKYIADNFIENSV